MCAGSPGRTNGLQKTPEFAINFQDQDGETPSKCVFESGFAEN